MNHQNKSDTLWGGREVRVKLFPAKEGEPLAEETFFVRQFRVGEYRTIFPLSDNEVALCARACVPFPSTDESLKRWTGKVEALTPESYEDVHQAMREVNEKGFFIYRQRGMERAMQNLKEMPPELAKQLAQAPAKPSLPTR
jgi:hypothetical protein